MHYVLEIIIPQVDNVEDAIEQVMEPFSECNDGDDLIPSAFWDFYIIGGRWAGHKMEVGLNQDDIQAFRDKLSELNVTVSGLQCGKQQLEPKDQIPMVDALWSEYFPEYNGRACPLFNHANDQYQNDCLYGDVMRVKDVSDKVSSSRFIYANYDYKGEVLEGKFMLSQHVWNGINYEDTIWDGKLGSAMKLHNDSIKTRNEEYIEKNKITDDMLAVTVDYHS